MKRLRYGVIGLGFFGEKHVEVLSAIPNVNLRAVCTRRPDRLADIAESYAVPKASTDYKELLADPDIDAVSIVTHVFDHRAITIEALASGKHVFLEKPMAGSVTDCEVIVEAARTAAGRFMVGHICRFDPRIALAKKAIDEGRIGKIVSLHAARNLPSDISAGVLDKISPLLGDGIHDTDLMLWMTGARVKSVYAHNVRVRSFKYPDIGWAMYRFDSDAVGVVETIWFLPENTPYTIDARMEIIGTTGSINIDCGNTGLTVNDTQGLSKPDTVYWPDFFDRRIGALRTELEYFVERAIDGRQIDVITPEESMRAVEAVLAAEESAETGCVVSL